MESELVGRDVEAARVDAIIEGLLAGGLRWWFRASLGSGNRRCCTTRGLERILLAFGP